MQLFHSLEKVQDHSEKACLNIRVDQGVASNIGWTKSTTMSQILFSRSQEALVSAKHQRSCLI